MLILTRKIGESLIIGDDVEITVLSVRGNQVKLGVNAPKEIAVHRQEIYERIKAAEDGAADEQFAILKYYCLLWQVTEIISPFTKYGKDVSYKEKI